MIPVVVFLIAFSWLNVASSSAIDEQFICTPFDSALGGAIHSAIADPFAC